MQDIGFPEICQSEQNVLNVLLVYLWKHKKCELHFTVNTFNASKLSFKSVFTGILSIQIRKRLQKICLEARAPKDATVDVFMRCLSMTHCETMVTRSHVTRSYTSFALSKSK